MLNLSSLQAALSPLKTLGVQERVVPIGDNTEIVLGILSQVDSAWAKQYVTEAMVRLQLDETTDITDRYILAGKLSEESTPRILACAVRRVGPVHVGEVEYIETNETLPDGTPIKESRREVMLQLINGLPPQVVTLLGTEYTKLEAEYEAALAKGIQTKPVDTAAEIERLTQAIEVLASGDPKYRMEKNPPKMAPPLPQAVAPVGPPPRQPATPSVDAEDGEDPVEAEERRLWRRRQGGMISGEDTSPSVRAQPQVGVPAPPVESERDESVNTPPRQAVLSVPQQSTNPRFNPRPRK